MRVLMVCLGNICRSPLAEGILRKKVEEQGLQWEIDSAGTGSWHIGEAPDPRSRAIAKDHGLDISKQRGRQFRAYDLEEFDLIYAMDSANYSHIVNQAKSAEERDKVQLIMNELWPEKNVNVPDPYWDDNGFEKVYQMLDAACDQIIEKYGKVN